MAKQFKIYFSESKEKIDAVVDTDVGLEKISIRRLETEMLITMFKLAARTDKDIDRSFECKDCVGQLNNLDAKDKYIEFTQPDINYAVAGFALTPGVRSYEWTEFGESILRQIKKPFGVDVKVKYNKKTNLFEESDK